MDLITISQALLMFVSLVLAITFIATTIGEHMERRAERKRNQERVNRINEIK
jgi:sensor domain CHASE-containing protein